MIAHFIIKKMNVICQQFAFTYLHPSLLRKKHHIKRYLLSTFQEHRCYVINILKRVQKQWGALAVLFLQGVVFISFLHYIKVPRSLLWEGGIDLTLLPNHWAMERRGLKILNKLMTMIFQAVELWTQGSALDSPGKYRWEYINLRYL